MSIISTSAELAGAKAPAEAPNLKVFRVSFTDTRRFHFIVKAGDDFAALAIAERRMENGDVGHETDSGFPELDTIDELQIAEDEGGAA